MSSLPSRSAAAPICGRPCSIRCAGSMATPTRRAAQRAGRSDAGGAGAGSRQQPLVLAEGPLRLREAARRGRHHRHQQERPAESRAARGSRAGAGRPLSPGRGRDRQRADRRRNWTHGSTVCPASLSSRPAMDVDYDVYAEGEALLGWLNATCRLSAADPFDGNRFLQLLAARMSTGARRVEESRSRTSR